METSKDSLREESKNAISAIANSLSSFTLDAKEFVPRKAEPEKSINQEFTKIVSAIDRETLIA